MTLPLPSGLDPAPFGRRQRLGTEFFICACACCASVLQSMRWQTWADFEQLLCQPALIQAEVPCPQPIRLTHLTISAGRGSACPPGRVGHQS